MMKKIVMFFFILFISNHCWSESIKHYIPSENLLSTDSTRKFIIGKEFPEINTKERELNTKLKFDIIDTIEFDIDQDGKKDTISIEKIENWNDPGDFHRILINFSNHTRKSFFNIDGWVNIRSLEFQYQKQFEGKSLLKSKYILLEKNYNGDYLIFSFGYPYASDPGLLSIIEFQKRKVPLLIFNDNYYLHSFNEENGELNVTQYYDDEIQKGVGKIKTYILMDSWFQLIKGKSHLNKTEKSSQ